MNSGSEGAGVEVTDSGRVTGAESEGRLRSVTTSELEEVEVISPAVDTGGETVVAGLERSRKMLSLSVSKLSLELAGVCVVNSVSVSVRVRVTVSALSVASGVMVPGLGRTVWGGLGSLVVGLVVVCG